MCRRTLASAVAILPIVLAQIPRALRGEPAVTTDQAAPAPAQTGTSIRPADPQAQLDAVLTRLRDSDERVRRIGAARAKNLPGSLTEAVEKAAEDGRLAADARAALHAALPYLRYRASRDELQAKTQAYDARSLPEAYEKAGKKDPRWDGFVREALGPTAGAAARLAALKKATDAGCDDPFVQYLYARTEWLVGGGDREAVLTRHRDAVEALAATKYPAEWKCRAAARYLEQTLAPHRRIIQICLDTLPAALKETGRPNEDVCTFVETVYNSIKPSREPHELFEQIDAAYSKSRPADDPFRYFFRGSWYVDYAWEARGSGVASTVTPQGWQLFHERLAVAREALETAWKIAPTDGRAPTVMITVAMGESAPRPEMEKWFGRAMKACPDNKRACGLKMQYLLPRWHGSHPEMIAFGRECLATEDWWGPLPQILVEAHEAVSKEVSDPKSYLANEQVWGDIEAVYRSFLDVFPDSDKAPWYRSNLAKWACDCGRWDAARKVFAEIGDKPDPTVFRSKAVYDYYRRKAQKKSRGEVQASAAEAAG